MRGYVGRVCASGRHSAIFFVAAERIASISWGENGSVGFGRIIGFCSPFFAAGFSSK
jgi:hypothetical protein